jgi:hypothetical protein
MMSKKEYDAQTKINQQALQSALLDVQKANAETTVIRKELEKAQILVDAKADSQKQSDVALNTAIQQSNNKLEEKLNEIHTEYADANRAANGMSDDERRADTCARIRDLAQRDPTYLSFICQ